jgi:hypothetical protein
LDRIIIGILPDHNVGNSEDLRDAEVIWKASNATVEKDAAEVGVVVAGTVIILVQQAKLLYSLQVLRLSRFVVLDSNLQHLSVQCLPSES